MGRSRRIYRQTAKTSVKMEGSKRFAPPPALAELISVYASLNYQNTRRLLRACVGGGERAN